LPTKAQFLGRYPLINLQKAASNDKRVFAFTKNLGRLRKHIEGPAFPRWHFAFSEG